MSWDFNMSWPEAAAGMTAPWSTSLLIIAACYLLGCFNSGYYLVRWRHGGDIREQGSGSTGATNVSRSLGAFGFAGTFILDLAKGALAVWLGMRFQIGPWGLILSILAVLAGHIWPIQLQFRGGKGVATFLGALLAADYFILLVSSTIFLIVFAFLRRFTLSGLAALALTAPVLAWWDKPTGRAFGYFILAVPVLYAHRHNLREDLTFMRGGATGNPSAGPPSQEE